MARLSSSDRARLPDSAFEYVAARERARRRLLNAAKRYGILPVGFITGQLRAERTLGAADGRTLDAATLPTGFVTFLLTDIEGSTGLLERLGDRYAALLKDVRAIIRSSVHRAGGRE